MLDELSGDGSTPPRHPPARRAVLRRGRAARRRRRRARQRGPRAARRPRRAPRRVGDASRWPAGSSRSTWRWRAPSSASRSPRRGASSGAESIDRDTLDLDLLPDPVVRLDADRVVVAANAAADALAGSAARRASARRDARPAGRAGPWLFGDCWPTGATLRSVSGMPEQVVVHPGRSGRADRTCGSRPATSATPTGGSRAPCSRIRSRPAGRPSGEPTGVEVVSTVSHELRSPLTSVKGYTSLLLNRWDRITDDQKRMMLEQVHHDADRVTRLITELLDISRLETGRLVLRRQLVDLPAMAATVVEKLTRDVPRPRVHGRSSPTTSRRSTPIPTSSSRCSPTSSRTPPSTAQPVGMRHRRRRHDDGQVCGRRCTDTGRGHPRRRPAPRLPEVLPPRPRQAHRHRPRPVDQPRPGRGPRRPAHGQVARRRGARRSASPSRWSMSTRCCRSWPARLSRQAIRSSVARSNRIS